MDSRWLASSQPQGEFASVYLLYDQEGRNEKCKSGLRKTAANNSTQTGGGEIDSEKPAWQNGEMLPNKAGSPLDWMANKLRWSRVITADKSNTR